MTAETFFAELQRLLFSLPKPPLRIENSEDCLLADNIFNCKNVNRSFDCYESTNLLYLYDSYLCDNCMDCDYAVESQLCYESVDPYKAFNCDYLEYCDDIRDSAYCYNCSNCYDLFGCVNLKNKSFCIFNRQFSEVEYKEKVQKYRQLPASQVLKIAEELKKRYPLTQTVSGSNENADFGNYIHFNKNCYLCFDAAHDENSAYSYDTFHCKNCYDLTYCGMEDNFCYENYYTEHCFNCDYSIYCSKCSDSVYIINSSNINNCFGCVGLANKQYCLLNRQLTQENYEKQKAQILTDISRQNLGWGGILF